MCMRMCVYVCVHARVCACTCVRTQGYGLDLQTMTVVNMSSSLPFSWFLFDIAVALLHLKSKLLEKLKAFLFDHSV